MLRAITELGFEQPTDIQAQAIPHLLGGDRDLIGLAQTGTGKTAAFGLPLLERIDPEARHVQALVLAPTRELGQQIAKQLEVFSKYLPAISTLAVYGGANIGVQIKALKRPQQVVIATPGRLIDLAERKAIRLDQVEYIVMDEADEMLNMGFRDELDRILSFTPESKRTWLFSATMPKEIRRMVNTYMDNPVEVRVNQNQEVNKNIEHFFAVVRATDKAEALMRFLDLDHAIRGVVFCRTKRDTQNLAEELLRGGYRADALHGDLSQAQRDRVMRRFRENDLQVLIATDVAARGIDVNDLTHVFHFSLPDDLPYYTHRSGRTARAGKQGVSIAFINRKEKSKINRLISELDIPFNQIMVPKAEEIAFSRVEQWAQTVLESRNAGRIPSEVLEHIERLFGPMTKEELIARLVGLELEKLNIGGGVDLNQKADRDGGGPRGKGGYSGKPKGKGGYRKGGYQKGGGGHKGGGKPYRKGGKPRSKRR